MSVSLVVDYIFKKSLRLCKSFVPTGNQSSPIVKQEEHLFFASWLQVKFNLHVSGLYLLNKVIHRFQTIILSSVVLIWFLRPWGWAASTHKQTPPNSHLRLSWILLSGSMLREWLSISMPSSCAAAERKSSKTRCTALVRLWGTDLVNLILLFTVTLPFLKLSISSCWNPARWDRRYRTGCKTKDDLLKSVF